MVDDIEVSKIKAGGKFVESLKVKTQKNKLKNQNQKISNNDKHINKTSLLIHKVTYTGNTNKKTIYALLVMVAAAILFSVVGVCVVQAYELGFSAGFSKKNKKKKHKYLL